MVMRIKVQYICMAFLYVGGFPLYAQKVTDDTISGKTHAEFNLQMQQNSD